MPIATRSQTFNAQLVGTVLLCSIGLWFAVARHAKFGFGGDPDSSLKRSAVIHVDAHGLDAVAIGVFFIGLGIVNLAVGIRDRRRIPVFWSGAGLIIAAALYGAALVVIEIVSVVRG